VYQLENQPPQKKSDSKLERRKLQQNWVNE